MNNYNLKKYEEKDYWFIYETKKEVYKKYVEANFGEWNEEMQKEFFEKYIAQAKNEIEIIIVNGEMAGFCQGADIDKKNYELQNICILPKFQGRGIGTKVLLDMIEQHKNKNIHLQYFKQNPVRKLYERLGFLPEAEKEYHYVMVRPAEKPEKKQEK